MEMRNGLGRTRIAGRWRCFFACDRWPGEFCRVSAFLFAFLGAQAAPIQLMSVGSTSPIDAQATSADEKSRSQLSAAFGRLPLIFEAADTEGSRFFSRGSGSHLWLSPAEAVLTFNPAREVRRKFPGFDVPTSRATDEAPAGAPLRIKLVGANAKARAVPAEELPTKVNYFIGNNPNQWRTQVRTFGKVRYQTVYPGIDLVYYGNQRQLEYDFEVAPGANPETIAWCYESAEKIQ